MTVEAPPTPKTFAESIPQEYRDKPYIKDIAAMPEGPEAMAAVFKKLDGAETLIGRKIGIPGADAKPDEVDKFYASLRPEKAEDYEIKVGEKPDEAFIAETRTAFHHAGISKVQAAKFMEKIVPGLQARQKAAAEAQTAQDKEFEGMVTSTFGKDGEKVLARVQEALKEHTPAPLKPFIDKLDNNALTILTGVVNAIMVKYMSEDDLKSKGAIGNAGGNDKAALTAEALKLQSSDAWKNFQHPDHAATVKRVDEIYAHSAFKS